MGRRENRKRQFLMLLMCHIHCRAPSFNTSSTVVGFRCCCWLWRKHAWLQMGLSVRRWPAPASHSPQGVIQGRSSWRRLYLLVTITVCETPSAEERDHHHSPSAWKIKKNVIFKGEHFRSHSQFANRYSSCIVLKQYLAAHTVSLRGTEFNSEISAQFRTLFSENLFLNA